MFKEIKRMISICKEEDILREKIKKEIDLMKENPDDNFEIHGTLVCSYLAESFKLHTEYDECKSRLPKFLQ